ncbi:hypothetical protein [Tessaracoccus sp. OH4464_COT-324]|uniref:hypothetical protein n=1 Tax=Tessaracoccus sp. OH4464_COT-324 TaxID=2491059 RepID=UPI000F630181|nr:hypothetical protein [Tessaracoccus sp. OH4464_COT-324]RRD47700.1 hypothetical protein EII42_00115 [Tessaracoccus sp. OH4464_COT-324]
MNPHASLLGIYQPQDGWLFRTPAGWKYLMMFGLALTAMIYSRWWLVLGLLAVALAILATSGINPRRALNIGLGMWILLAVLAVFQVVGGRFDVAVTSPGTVLLAVLASRILTLTTSTPELIDALSKGFAVLRLVGINPRTAALAVAIMVRSIPYLVGSFGTARDAARARGRDGSFFALLVPTLVAAVAYAANTGEALHARALLDTEPS